MQNEIADKGFKYDKYLKENSNNHKHLDRLKYERNNLVTEITNLQEKIMLYQESDPSSIRISILKALDDT